MTMPRADARTIEQSDTFRKWFERLPPGRQYQIGGTIEKLGHDPPPPGLHTGKLRRARASIRSARINSGDRLVYEVVSPDKLWLLAGGTHQQIERLIDGTSVFRAITVPGDELHPSAFGELTVFEPRNYIGGPFSDELGALLSHVGAFDCLGTALNIIEQMVSGDTSGKARPPHLADGVGAAVNVIPAESSTQTGGCTPALLAFCFDGDSFDARMLEIERHVTLYCRDAKLVLLVTTQWQPKIWRKKYENAFTRLDPLVAIFFYGLGGLTRLL